MHGPLQVILEEEEELISAHRAQIERNMSLVRDEMTLLGEARPSPPHWPAQDKLVMSVQPALAG